MESRAKILGHAGHQLLIVFPLGLLTTSLVFDLAYYFFDEPSFGIVGYWMVAAGIIGGFLAAPFGWIDWFAIPRATRAKRIGLIHGVGNMFVVVLFILNWWMRIDNRDHAPEPLALAFSIVGIALAAVTGWLGGELVDRLGVGIDNGANLNSPNSLSGRAATDTDNPITDTHGQHA